MTADVSNVPRVPAGSADGGQWTRGSIKKMAAAREARTGMADMFDRVSKPDGGFTYQPMLEYEPTEGYAVSAYPERAFVADTKDLSFDDFTSYAQRNQDLFSKPDHFLGAWNDPQTGKVFLDVSQVTKTEAEAARLARAHDQISYYDLHAHKSIDVNRSRAAEIAAMQAQYDARGRPR